MKEYIVRILWDGKAEEVPCAEGSSLFQVLEGKYRERVNTPCGGKQKCGKCRVQVEGDGLSAPSPFEKTKLSPKEISSGVRLACASQVLGDVTVTLGLTEGAVQILEGGLEFTETPEPWVRKTFLSMTEPSLSDQRSDLRRVKDALNSEAASGEGPGQELVMRTSGIAALPEMLRHHNYSVTAVWDPSEILSVEPGDTRALQYGVAVGAQVAVRVLVRVDIGTTTVVAYLMDLVTGKKTDVVSGLNAQRAYGHDVISRINHTLQDAKGLDTLHASIVGQLNGLIGKLAERNSIRRSDIYTVTLAGNTTMMHLAAGLPPKYIASVPFIPAAREKMLLRAEDFGFDIAGNGRVIMLPGISAYVGADIVAAILASGMSRDSRLSLLIDIGTNGEIVLGNADSLISCSTAAGPAFEGAAIRNGVGGIAGAINTMSLDGKGLFYTTIEHEKPLGICGSGIVDAVSNLLTAGVIDETGRMQDRTELQGADTQFLADRLVSVDNQAAFVIAGGTETKTGEDIVLTQKDVREIQNAKASIAAGIMTLIKHAGKQEEDIETVYLAGGFGSFMNKYHAVRIGLLPKALESKIRVIGNAAGSGSVLALLSRKNLVYTADIADRVKYVELSSSAEFMEDYINCMTFDA